MAGEWNGVPFQPHTLEIADSTPVPVIITEWLLQDGLGYLIIVTLSSAIRWLCDPAVRLQYLLLHAKKHVRFQLPVLQNMLLFWSCDSS